ncbi:Ldh family oxidoreductase [Candidatus Poribacteria bacterium]|nr:Ldh family oxidoreductase [Candidatus Poribacteria bacterium]
MAVSGARTLSEGALRGFARAIFEASGVPRDEAEIVTEVLVRANLSGHDSHGVIRIPQYCGSIRAGVYVPGAALDVVHSTPTTRIYDAHWGLGQVAMTRALDESMRLARDVRLFSFGIRQCNHIGRLGHYAEVAAANGFVSIVTVNSTGMGAAVAPYGGREGRLGTNPFCMAFPTGRDPILVDMTSSIVAEGKIRVKRNRGEKLPDGWILDRQGNPSNDPADFYGPPRGAILPFGGEVAHKGFALSILVELLSGTLTGAGNVGEREGQIGNGVFCLLMDVEAFRPLGDFESAATRLAEYVRSCPPAEGFQRVIMPGEPEAETRRRRSASGIEIDATTWSQLADEAARYGCETP